MKPKRIRGNGRTRAVDMGTHHSKCQSIPDISLLPEEVLLQILSLVPAPHLIRRCSLVCTLWRDVINSPRLWKIKCQNMGYISKWKLKTPRDWKQFYYLSSKKRNLLKNPCAMEGFKFWTLELNGGDEWKIEDLPGDQGQDFPHKDVTKYFVTSYLSCKKSQLIDLKKMGYREELLDDVQPNIVISDWYAARADCACRYKFGIELLSNKKIPIKVYDRRAVIIQQWNDAQWRQMTYTFRNYGPGVRYVYFHHGGQDTQFMNGWYGIRVTNTSVTIEPEALRA